jgi:murein DD-endopeptidase MepM/ murein hydrolase activator NlpD
MATILDPVPIKQNHESNFGEDREDGPHTGVDLPVPVGTKVKAPMNGIITVADMNFNSKCGGTIDIDYKNGYTSRFCHMSKINVEVGDQVEQGQVVGLSGGERNTPGAGRTTGPHLHWTFKLNGELVDPIEHRNTDIEMIDVVPSDGKTKSDVSDLVGKIFNKSEDDSIFQNITKGMAKSMLGLDEEIKRFKQLIK